MKSKRRTLLYTSVTIILSFNYANAQYRIPTSAFGGGGNPVSGANFRISSSAGQTFIGTLKAATFKKQVGFWRQAQMLRLYVANPIADKILPDGNRLQKQKLTGLNPVFAGNVGTLTFVANSSNTAFVEASIVGSDTLQVRGKTNSGDIVVTVTLSATDVDSVVSSASFRATVTGVTDVERLTLLPTEFALEQNYPNPFNPSTSIRFALKDRSKVTLLIFNLLGQTIATLVDEELAAGWHESRFSSDGVVSGVYIYRLSANQFIQTRKMLLLK
jgi:hypothetical protein